MHPQAILRTASWWFGTYTIRLQRLIIQLEYFSFIKVFNWKTKVSLIYCMIIGNRVFNDSGGQWDGI